MAITSYEYVSDKNGPKSSCSKYSINNMQSNINPLSSSKNSCTTNPSLTSNNKCKKTNIDKYISPYFSDDRIQLLSHVTEKRFLHKNHDFMSSFPLAVNIYKANSDDLRSSKRFSKKVKKSVLTLPNAPTPLPQACTVSDINDSEYFNDDKIYIKPKQKKKRVGQSRKKSRVRNSQIDLYESNAKNYSQKGNNSYKSSKDVLHFTGDDVMKLKRPAKNNTTVKSNHNAHDVWTLLRKINNFKFVPSPPISQESSLVSVRKVKKRKNNKQRSNQKNTRVIETCRTEEFAYISSFVDNSPNSCSQSSFDRITVIEKQNEIQNIKCSAVKNQIDCPTNSYMYHSRTMRNIDRSNKSKSKKCHLKGGIHAVKSNDKIIIAKKLLPEIQNNNVPRQNQNKKYQNSEIVQQKSFDNNENNLMETSLINKVNINQNKINDIINRSNVSEKSTASKEHIIKCKNKMISSRIELENLTPNESQQDVAGITKVVLSKGQKVLLTKQIAAIQRKSRTTTSDNSEKHKISLTLSEIKRKIRSITFPLVILAKDQLSSTIRVENYDPPQFAGLDEHIWPFMRLWCGNSDDNPLNSSNNKINYYSNLNSGALDTNDYYTNELCNLKDPNITLPVKKKEKSLVRIKPLHRIKNSMMQFMHKKTCLNNEVGYNINSGQMVDIGINTVNNLSSLKRYSTELRKDTKIDKKHSTSISYAKTKSKWASDLIENVIQKIKNGIYYSHDDKAENREPCNNMKEDGVQTDIENMKSGPSCDFINEVKKEIYSDIDKIVLIPGFDNRLSDLEIETLNHFNRVEVKHCVTNVIIQFDVALSCESDRVLQIKQSHPCVPVSLDENQPTIFKCKTAIINAILPAELCSILPKIMKNIIHINSKLALSSSTINNNSNLSTITEITRCESDSNKYSIPVHIHPKLKINNVSEGNFSSPYIIKTVKRGKTQSKSLRLLDWTNMKELLIDVQDNINLLPLSDLMIRSIKSLTYSNKTTPFSIGDVMQSTERGAPCKTLQPYQFSEKKILSMRENCTFMRIVDNILRSQKFNITVSHNSHFKVISYKYSFNINFVSLDNSRFNFIIPHIKIYDLHNDLRDNINGVHKLSVTSNLDTYYAPKAMTKPLCTSKSNKPKSTVELCVNTIKTKKKRFIKLYKKCKSMSNILTNRSSLNLNKITNLEEFCLAMGSGKLSGVLDGNVAKKILSSIKEMKNWITDITPRQAMLVLLLANKKDTTNLVQYRSLILQGISVNRITRSSELDMEIEVIERENLSKLAKYEGITYLPASEENQDILLEELCWIAKTTASDYQKPFDKSSERLLKPLLAKRKKLNPSYLRVMARYVGLGLLKTSK